MDDNCIFCKIINKEIPSNVVYENEEVLAFKDINPQAPIHIIVIPKKHFRNALEADSQTISRVFEAIKKIVKDLQIEERGFRVITNCGKDAGQTVEHLHFHILGGKTLGEKIV